MRSPHRNKKNNCDQTNQLEKRKYRGSNLEGKFLYELGTCSKTNDLSTALSLYDNAVSQKLKLLHNHFDTLLYLCSNALKDPSSKDFGIEKGFYFFHQMLANNINPTEATIATVARFAQAKGDGDFAFELVKTMGKYNISPRLRTYDPALFAFCENLEAEKAYLVEEHMISNGIQLEELHLGLLLKVSGDVGNVDKVYSYLHKLRNCVRCVKKSSAEIIEGWFRSTLAFKVGSVDWDESRIKDSMVRNGGGWHGQGWLGKGEWVVSKSNIDHEAVCCSCGQQLACADIDKAETERFSQSLASLAIAREANSNFQAFQAWLDTHATYETIVDGANVAFYRQNFAAGGFNISKLDVVVKELFERNGKKWPLIILHNKRVRPLLADPSSRRIIENWKKQGALYTTPDGSNDDWYWLYAAVKLKCLVVTNDEMRDHIFEILGSSFFLQWKERHRIRFTLVKNTLKLLMPPPYSIVIQESDKGSWHVPVEGEYDDEKSRTWLCITRPPTLCETASIEISNGSHITDDQMVSVTAGKRKHRDPSP
ncbi:ribonuclease P [Ranunculus cassubicifolius]